VFREYLYHGCPIRFLNCRYRYIPYTPPRRCIILALGLDLPEVIIHIVVFIHTAMDIL
jgi:hypothetical protein